MKLVAKTEILFHAIKIIPKHETWLILTPSFFIVIFLAFSNLQLGIRNVFEPGHADFSQMTTDENIYVTNIEQAVTVTIRNYMEAASPLTNNMKKRKYALISECL